MPWLSAFTAAAARYWLSVFPMVGAEVRGWEGRAGLIADRSLRALALGALRLERGNLEGAAAFAAFLHGPSRRAVVRAAVAFQAAYDYADALSEQPSDRPSANAYRLHAVLPAALGEGEGDDDDYHRHHANRDDGGYLHSLRDTCRAFTHSLPAYSSVAQAACDAALRIQAYQSLNLSETYGGHGAMARWAGRVTPPGTGLRWWEVGASAGSSLLVFALLTAAYFPWIGALHTLLDSLVDEREDTSVGHRSLLHYYRSPEEAARRMAGIAAQAAHHARTLEDSVSHSLILAAMASFYLSAAPSHSPYARLAAPSVLAAMGGLARPTMLVMGTRHRARQIKARALAARHRRSSPASPPGPGRRTRHPPLPPPADPLTPPADPLTPPADPLTPPADPLTPPACPLTPPADHSARRAQPAREPGCGEAPGD